MNKVINDVLIRISAEEYCYTRNQHVKKLNKQERDKGLGAIHKVSP